MKAVRKLRTGPGGVDLVEVEPRPVEPGTVSIAVAATGVCGTDLHIEADEYPTTPPVTMGHEISGTVVGTGADVSSSWVGTRVVCETYFDTCETCRWCLSGRRNLCPRRRSLGSHVDGGFAAEVIVPSRNLHRVPDGVGAQAAALSEPLACVCHALLDPPLIGAGDRVLVTGPGPIGLLAAQVAMAMGGRVEVAGLPADRDRLDLAATLGADVADVEVASEVDVAVECSGSAGGVRTCLQALRRAGRYVQIGVFGRDITVDLNAVLLKEIVVSSGFASTPESWSRAMTLLAGQQVRLDPLVSTVMPLEQWRTAFDDLRGGRGFKILLAPQATS